MSVAANALLYQEPGKLPSAVLAVLVHVLLAVFLFFGVHWQSKQPEAVMVELWNSLPAPAVEKVVAQPEPLPKPEVKPEIKPEPKVEKAVEPPKPDIALEKRKELKKKEPPKQEEPKKEPAKKPEPKLNLDRSKDFRAEAERETVALERSRNLDKMKREIVPGTPAVAGTSKAKDAWIAGIVGKIKPNVVAQPNIPGNPEAIFDVTLLPTGEVLAVRLRKSSGFKSYDEALERAILKSSPLPKPDRPELFESSLELKFRPLD
jgi:colicin import membrane protein